MAKYLKSKWVQGFWKTQIYFNPVSVLAHELAPYSHWPTLKEYQTILESAGTAIKNANGQLLNVVEQGPKAKSFEENYAPRIYLTGEMQTRTENWHDFFQVLTWRLFPKTKSIINQRQYLSSSTRVESNNRYAGRTNCENMLSLFDECGAVLLYTDTLLAQFAKDYEWKQLLWDHRYRITNRFSCFVFGHALFEKLFNPYIGMTANCIFIRCDSNFFSLPLSDQINFIDSELSQRLSDEVAYQNPADLSPFPILGLPGWYPQNQDEAFYDNSSYFRPKKSIESRA